MFLGVSLFFFILCFFMFLSFSSFLHFLHFSLFFFIFLDCFLFFSFRFSIFHFLMFLSFSVFQFSCFPIFPFFMLLSNFFFFQVYFCFFLFFCFIIFHLFNFTFFLFLSFVFSFLFLCSGAQNLIFLHFTTADIVSSATNSGSRMLHGTCSTPLQSPQRCTRSLPPPRLLLLFLSWVLGFHSLAVFLSFHQPSTVHSSCPALRMN